MTSSIIMPERKPHHIYRYSTAQRAAQILTDLKLYMAPISVLNDLYEFNLQGFWREDDDSKCRIFAKRLLMGGHASDFAEALALAREMPTDDLSKEYREWLDDNAEVFDQITQHSGVACFSEHANNQRMWGTYGANHTGAQIEFHTDPQKWAMATSLRPVIYTSQRLPICPSQLIVDQPPVGATDFEVLTMLLCAKHMDWREEAEWRLVMLALDREAAGDRLIPFPRSAINHVFLGPRISQPDEDAIRKAASSQIPEIPVLKRKTLRSEAKEYYEGVEEIKSFDQVEYWSERFGKHKM